MTCYYPNVIVQDLKQINPETMKPKIVKFWGYHEFRDTGKEFEQIENLNKTLKNEGLKYKLLPCGKCIGCRLDYSKEWATRCMLEAKEYEENYFITLTYNDENLPKMGALFDKETGEILYKPSETRTGCLKKEDTTKFLKDLRNYFYYHYNHTGIRFYLCGEYGSSNNTARPHYHAILFNLPLRKFGIELEHLFNNKENQPIYKCSELESIWGRGIISVGAVEWSSCAYVSRYITKKINGPGSDITYAEKGQIKEFVNMSRKPGIAREYYERNKENIYENDEILEIMKTVKGKSIKPKPGKYYDRLYDLDSPEALKAIKEQREAKAQNAINVKMSKTSLTLDQQLRVEERTLLDKAKILKREMVEI